MPTIDDFEDGDINVETADWSGWTTSNTGDGGVFTREFGDLEGEENLQVRSSTAGAVVAAEVTHDGPGYNGTAKYWTSCQQDSSSGNARSRVVTEWGDLRYDIPNGEIYFDHGGGSTLLTSYSSGVTYKVELAQDASNNEVAVTVNGTSYGPFPLKNNTTISSVEVTARNGGDSLNTDLYFDYLRIEGTIPAAPPANVSNSIPDDDTATVTWDEDSSGGTIDEYEVELQTDGGSWTRVADLGSAARSHTETVARSVDSIRWRVRSVNSGGASDWSYSETETTNAKSLSVTDTRATEFDLSWTDPSANDGTDVLLAEASGSTAADYSASESVGATASAATITNLEHGERYFVRVQATYTGSDGTPAPVSNEAATTTALPAPSLDSLDASTEGEITVNYTLNDNSADGDVLVERSSDGGSTWSEAGTIDNLGATSWTDTGLLDGERYTYRLTRRTDHAESISGTLAATTILPAPADITPGNVTATSVDVSWTVNANNGSQRVEYRRSSDSAWSTDVSGLSTTTTSETVGELLNGEAYDVRVVAVTDHTETPSALSSATTALPDEDQPQLGNGVEDEIAVDRGSQTTNYGSVRVHYRETGASSWIDWGVVAYDRLDPVITGLEDGEEYEVRLRTETEHVTGTWTDPVSIVTQFPGATQLTVTSAGQTSVDLEFQDNADNEDGVYLERREQFRDGGGEWRRLKDLGPNAGTGTVTATDAQAQPDTTYRYRVIPYTEHSQAVSDSVETTTADDGVRTDRVPPQGWHVVIETPSGATLTPTVLGEPSANPRLNDPPTIELDVAGRGWRTDELKRQPVRAWVDGERVPVDYLTHVIETPEGYRLRARGSQALDTHVTVAYTQKESHLALRELITNNTDLVEDVDDPASSTAANTLIRTGTADDEWESFIPDAPFPDDDPRRIQNGHLGTHPSATYAEGESGSYQNAVADFFGDRFADGVAAEMAAIGDKIEWTQTTEYDYPSADALVAFRLDYSGSTHPGIEAIVDGTTVQTISKDADFSGFDEPAWVTFNIGSLLAAGEHTVSISVTEAASDDSPIFVDAVSLGDGRHVGYGQETLSNGGQLSYPRLHASPLEVVSDDVETTRLITAGELSSQWTSTANDQAVAISDDQGASWTTAANSTSVDTTLGGDETQLRARFTLSYYDSGGGPVVYDAGTEVDLWELYASLEDTPLLIDQVFEGRLRDVLTEICEWSEFVWEYRYVDGQPTISVTTPGQRTAEADETVVDFEIEEDFESQVRRAVVFGRSQTETGKQFSANHGTAVDLPDAWLQPGRETVVDPSDGTEFVRGDDYEMGYQDGTITTLSTGAMTDGADYEIDYEARTRGVYESPDYSGDPVETLTETIPAVVTQSAAEQVAFRIVREASDVRTTATIDIQSSARDWSLVDAVDFAGVPMDGEEIYDVADTPGGMQLQVANRDPVSETVGQIRSRLEATARNV